jgi:flagellar FliL protein
MKIIIIAAAVLVLAGGGGFAGFTFLGKAGASDQPHEEPPRVGVLYTTRERIVNLADAGVLRYLKTTIVLEIYDPENKEGKGGEGGKVELPKDLLRKAPMIEDRITAVLTSKSAAELMGPEGKAHLKEALKTGLNETIGEERILNVYFTDFIIQ